MKPALSPQTPVAVAGAGAMGAGIAQVAAAAGHPVKLFDTRPGAAAAAVEEIRGQFKRLASKGKISEDAAAAASQRLVAADALAELAAAGLVIEAIIEDLAAKQALFVELESLCGDDCLFATNTSSISVTAIGAALKNPGRLAGLHFFNPAPLMALVEVVSGLASDPAVAATLLATARAWGKTPVHTRSTPGFIVNRVARPYYAEALRQLHEGIADCATLDAVLREAGGFKMGPFELIDLVGLDINFAVTQSVWQAYFNDPRFTPSPVLREYVAAGWLGRKTRRGFFDYAEGTAKPAPATEAAYPVPAAITLVGDSALATALAERLAARGIAFQRAAEAAAGLVARAGDACLMLTDGRSATRRACCDNQPNTIVVDLALDYAKATRLAIAAAESCSPEAIAAGVGLLQAAGFAVSRLKDAPGLPVMRALTTLANEAADAVNQGVATAEAIDTAMRLGVSYPRGPLEWAAAVGLSVVRDVLVNLAASYGEDRYRLSPWLQQEVDAALLSRKP
jgi:3-hydroxybutyryl-CoA dehydrogenase